MLNVYIFDFIHPQIWPATAYHGRSALPLHPLRPLPSSVCQPLSQPSRLFLRSDLGQNQLVMLAPELGGCAKLTILDISGNAITAAAIPPGLFKTTQLARLWRDGCPIAEAELSALDGFAEFQQREAAREAKKLDQRRGETGDVMFVEQKGGGASQQNMHS